MAQVVPLTECLWEGVVHPCSTHSILILSAPCHVFSSFFQIYYMCELPPAMWAPFFVHLNPDPFCCVSVDPDSPNSWNQCWVPCLGLMDLDLDPAPDTDPTTDPTWNTSMQKNIFFIFFLITCPQADHLQSKKFKFFLKFCGKILFFRHYFSPLNTFMRKRKDSEPDPYLWLLDPDPGRPKNMRIRIPNTAWNRIWDINICADKVPMGERRVRIPAPVPGGGGAQPGFQPSRLNPPAQVRRC